MLDVWVVVTLLRPIPVPTMVSLRIMIFWESVVVVMAIIHVWSVVLLISMMPVMLVTSMMSTTLSTPLLLRLLLRDIF